jgi:hypothetical protein
MSSSYIPWWISAVWVALTLLIFLVVDVSSVRNWVLVTTIGVVPPFVLLRLWSVPTPTVAEMMRATDVRR